MIKRPNMRYICDKIFEYDIPTNYKIYFVLLHGAFLRAAWCWFIKWITLLNADFIEHRAQERQMSNSWEGIRIKTSTWQTKEMVTKVTAEERERARCDCGLFSKQQEGNWPPCSFTSGLPPSLPPSNGQTFKISLPSHSLLCFGLFNLRIAFDLFLVFHSDGQNH